MCRRCASAAEDGDDAFVEAALERCERAAGEQARTTARLLAAIERTTDGLSRALLLERVAEIELYQGSDPAGAASFFHGVLEQYPGHLASLRALERLYMRERDDAGLEDVEGRLATVGHPHDAAGHVRLAARLALRDGTAPASAADEVLQAAFDYVEVDLWLARRVEAAARASGDMRTLAQALTEVAQKLEDPGERTSIELRVADALADARSGSAAAAHLSRAASAMHRHPTLAEEQARLYLAGGDYRAAAAAYEVAAREAEAPAHALSLFHFAGCLWEDQVGDPARAADALVAAARIDPSYEQVLDRLARLLPERGGEKVLADLVKARLARGADPATERHLQLLLANVYQQLGDLLAAKQALRAIIGRQPQQVDALVRLARVCIADGDTRGAIDALQRLTRATEDPRLLRGAWLQLGDVHVKRRDRRQARAAYEQVIALFPDDATARDRLARLGG